MFSKNHFIIALSILAAVLSVIMPWPSSVFLLLLAGSPFAWKMKSRLAQIMKFSRHRRDELTQNARRLQKAHRSVQRVATTLTPHELESLAFEAVVEEWADEVKSRSGIECEVGIHFEDKRISAARALAAFRLVQEGLTNAVCRSENQKLRIDLFVSNDGVTSTPEISRSGGRSRTAALKVRIPCTEKSL